MYSTCSLEPEEDEQVVHAVLADNREAWILPAGDRIAQMHNDGILTAEGAEKLTRCITAEGFLRLSPGVHGTDGFFIALVEKSG